MRRKTFNYDDVFWLPATQGVVPKEDTLFADLCELADKMLNADEYFAENEEAMETSEQIQIELEGRRTLLAIDGRKFKAEVSSQSLEKFIGNLLNAEVDVKVILITNNGEDGTSMEMEEEGDTINLGPIDFKATALLFGEI
jgi:hypothetical protein